jgi:hypothetical protein
MQDVNWNTFKAKFNRREQDVFQWLCYLLFCIEFNQPLGVSRYENHAGIETDPIKCGDSWVGWQAKFYDTRLSEHKKDFISSINTTKTRHSELTKLIFYVNKDFGQDKKKCTPSFKKAIEDHAKSKGVVIIWKTSSFFESPFVTIDNATIAKYFFSHDKGIFDLIEDLNKRSESILYAIQSKISFTGKEIKIDRSIIVTSLNEAIKSDLPLIISGEGGSFSDKDAVEDVCWNRNWAVIQYGWWSFCKAGGQ